MLLDTSVILELLRHAPNSPVVKRILAVVGDTVLFASPIHMGEVADTARRSDVSPEETVARALQMVELIPLTSDIAVVASAIKAEARQRKSGRDFSLIDGIGLASARSRGLPMLTMDHEFEGFADVTILDR